MDSDLDISLDSFNLSEFLNISSSSENDEIAADTLCEQRTDAITQKLCEVSAIQIKNKMSYKSVTDVNKLLNNTPGAQIKIPEKREHSKNTSLNVALKRLYSLFSVSTVII